MPNKPKKVRSWKAWAVMLDDLSYEYDPGTSRHGRYSVYVSRASALKAAYDQKDSVVAVTITEVVTPITKGSKSASRR